MAWQSQRAGDGKKRQLDGGGMLGKGPHGGGVALARVVAMGALRQGTRKNPAAAEATRRHQKTDIPGVFVILGHLCS